MPQDYRWGRAYEGYSSNPRWSPPMPARWCAGCRARPTRDLLAGNVIASTKHFLADGGTDRGVDQGDATIDEAGLRDIHGAPYGPAIENGVATVMASL